MQVAHPDWEPLTRVLGKHAAASFMWMHEIALADGSSLHAYKHVTTRRYLHIARDGRAFVHGPDDRYSSASLAWAVPECSPAETADRSVPSPGRPPCQRLATVEFVIAAGHEILLADDPCVARRGARNLKT